MVALTVGVAWGQWREDGKVRPDTAWRKSAGALGAMLLVTDEPEKFFEQWNHPAAPDYKPNITTVTEVHRGQKVAAVVIFKGCQADKSGNCNLEADYQLFRPDGSVYGGQKDVELWKGRPAPPEPNLQLGVGVLALTVESDDPLGTYTVEASVRDRNAKVEFALKQELKVVPREQAGGYAHVSCPEFVSFDAAQQVMFTKGFLAGLGATMGVLNSSVRAVQKTAADPSQAKGAELAAAGVTKALSGDAGASDESLAKSIAGLCAQPRYVERPAASAAVDLLMGIKP